VLAPALISRQFRFELSTHTSRVDARTQQAIARMVGRINRTLAVACVLAVVFPVRNWLHATVLPMYWYMTIVYALEVFITGAVALYSFVPSSRHRCSPIARCWMHSASATTTDNAQRDYTVDNASGEGSTEETMPRSSAGALRQWRRNPRRPKPTGGALSAIASSMAPNDAAAAADL